MEKYLLAVLFLLCYVNFHEEAEENAVTIVNSINFEQNQRQSKY